MFMSYVKDFSMDQPVTLNIPWSNTTPSYQTVQLDDFVVYESSTATASVPCKSAPKKQGRNKKEAPMGRYYDEYEDRYVDAMIGQQSDLAKTRSYLSSRVDDLTSTKQSDIHTFFLAEPSLTTKERAKRIADGK